MLLVDRDMSSDTAKENASVVDSSVTDWKQDMGNSDDPGKLNDEGAFYLYFRILVLKLVWSKLFVRKFQSLHWICMNRLPNPVI